MFEASTWPEMLPRSLRKIVDQFCPVCWFCALILIKAIATEVSVKRFPA